MADTGNNIVGFEEALVTQISGVSHPNDHIAYHKFIPCRHGWNFPELDESVDLQQSSFLCFTQWYTFSEITFAALSSLSDVLCVAI